MSGISKISRTWTRLIISSKHFLSKAFREKKIMQRWEKIEIALFLFCRCRLWVICKTTIILKDKKDVKYVNTVVKLQKISGFFESKLCMQADIMERVLQNSNNSMKYENQNILLQYIFR